MKICHGIVDIQSGNHDFVNNTLLFFYRWVILVQITDNIVRTVSLG